ncbi:MAG: hypothetical protein ACUVX8_07215 [Candidatus Zipacnadales bacterium]
MAMRRCVCLLAAFIPLAGRADIIVAYEVVPEGGIAGDVDILARLLKSDGTLGWADPKGLVVVAASDHAETSPVVVPDCAGGVIVVYDLEFLEGEHKGDADILAQRIGPEGTLLWNEGRAPVLVASSSASERKPVAISDGQGGVIVAYEWTDEEGDTDILAQRLDAQGRCLWLHHDLPALVATSPRPERNCVLVPDGTGGVIALFEWYDVDGDSDIMAQHIGPNGEALWNGGERAVDVSATKARERNIAAVPDGEGGALVAFEFEWSDGEYAGDVDVMAQRISGEGVLWWNGGQEPAPLSTGRGIERSPTAVTDGQGGMMVAFEYEPLEGEFAGDIDILAQRIDGAGTLLWNEGAQSILVSAASGLERSAMTVALPDGSMVVFLEHEFRGGEHSGDIDILAQRISPTGELLWKEGKESVMVAGAKWLERSPFGMLDDGTLVAIFPMIGPEGEWEGDEDIRAMAISLDGELLWNEGKESTEIAGSTLIERTPKAVVVRR